MGLGSFLKKSIKNSFRGGSLYKLSDKGDNMLRDIFGLNAFKDLAAGQDAQIRAQAEQNKLNTANEIQNVVQFEDDVATGGGSDQRRRKTQSGAYARALNLNI